MHKRPQAVLLTARYHCLVDRGADLFSFFFFSSLFFNFNFRKDAKKEKEKINSLATAS